MTIIGSTVTNIGPAPETISLPGQGEKVTVYCVGPQCVGIALKPTADASITSESFVLPRERLDLTIGDNSFLSMRATPADSLSAHSKCVVCVIEGTPGL